MIKLLRNLTIEKNSMVCYNVPIEFFYKGESQICLFPAILKLRKKPQ